MMTSASQKQVSDVPSERLQFAETVHEKMVTSMASLICKQTDIRSKQLCTAAMYVLSATELKHTYVSFRSKGSRVCKRGNILEGPSRPATGLLGYPVLQEAMFGENLADLQQGS